VCIKIFAKFQRGHPVGPLNRVGVRKYRNFRPITCYISETVEDRLEAFLQALNPLSNCVTFTTIVPGVYTGEAEMCKKCAKMANFWTSGLNYWETVEDRWVYIQRGVLQALNPLSNRVTFTTIVPRAYIGEAKMCKNVLKWRTFKLQAWITGKLLKIDGYIQRGILQALNYLSNHVKSIAIVPVAYTGKAEMCKKCAKMSNF